MKARHAESCDVIIVGGGVIGLGVAFELLEKHRQVTVVDAGHPGKASPAAAGMLAPAAESDVELPGLAEFRRWSHSLYPDFVQRLERCSGKACDMQTRGTLVVACTRDQHQEVLHLREIMQQEGFRSRSLNAKESLEMEPALSPRVVSGLYLEEDHWIDPDKLLQSLRASIESLGGSIVDGANVTYVDPGGRVEISYPGRNGSEAWEADCIVYAAGSWSGGGILNLPVKPIKGQTLHLRAPGFLQRVVRTPDIYIVPQAGGHLVVGATVEDQGFETRPTAGATLDLLRFAWQVLPGVYDLPLEEIRVGLRPSSRDQLPLLGNYRDKLYVATGHYRNGILAVPGTARVMADLIIDGKRHEALKHFDVARLSVDNVEC